MPGSRDRAGLAAALTVIAPGAARAHGGAEGLEGFYLGLLHPASSAAPLLAALAFAAGLGLAASPRPAAAAARIAAGATFGLGLALAGAAAEAAGPWLLGAAILLALRAALIPAGSAAEGLSLAPALGLLAGWATAPDPAPAGAMIATGLGAVAAFSMLALYGGLGAARLAAIGGGAGRIAARVVAAWAGAAAILILAFELSGRGV